MKASIYNFFFLNDATSEEYIIYNSLSGALALMTKAQYEQYNNYINCNLEIQDKSFYNDLIKGGFILPDELNELNKVKDNLLQGRYQTRNLQLTIAPTSDCNFRCIYCYEKDSNKHPPMTLDVQTSLIEFVKAHANNISTLNVCWYGGEPLLCMDVIESLTKHFKEICSQNNIIYSASIITNGYLLTKSIASKFLELNIHMVQVTLDGDEQQHNCRRPLKNGQGTFNTIVTNLKNLKGVLPYKVSLRINADKTNIDASSHMLSLLKEQGISETAIPYLAMVQPSNGCCADTDCYTAESFATLYYQFELSKDPQNLLRFYPRLRTNACGADSISSFVVDSDGLMYKCWNDIGIPEMAIGSLLNKYISQDEKIKREIANQKYFSFDPTNDAECSKCKFLPICMGGCPSQRLQSRNHCTSVKYYIEQYIHNLVDELVKKNVKE